MSACDLEDRAALVVLSGLPGIGPGRLRALAALGGPAAVLSMLRAGRLRVDAGLAAACAGAEVGVDVLLARWGAAARAVDTDSRWQQHQAAGVRVLVPGDPAWPSAFLDDPDAPSILFATGDLDALRGRAVRGNARRAGPIVAVVGTRRCSQYGIEVARQLGADLTSAGVGVVSGLAIGIDGAAHRGALQALESPAVDQIPDARAPAPPVAVVATGLDVHYPRGHRLLWEQVAAAGLVVSESPLGTPPARWRFPARNRIIAALADAVVVVESAAAGGALLTVDEAVRRDRPVLAVPGPVTSRASTGTNRLLAEGAMPACDLGDVLLAIGVPVPQARRADAASTPPSGDGANVLAALGWQPATLDQLVLRTGLAFGVVAHQALELEAGGWLVADGGWLERRR